MSNDITVQQNATKQFGIKGALDNPAVRKRFEEILGKNAAGFVSSIISAVQGSAELQKCDPRSVIASAAVAATLNLPINPSLAFAHIVPYKGVAQFQLGWRGFVQLALRTGTYKTIHVTEVYDGEMRYENRFTGDIEFDSTKRNSDEIVGYYAYFRLVSGFEKGLYMSKNACVAHAKKHSQGYGKHWSHWTKNFDAMAMKTVVKQLLSRWAPLSIEAHHVELAMTSDQASVTVNDAGEFSFAYVDNQPEQDDESSARQASISIDSLSSALAAKAQAVTDRKVTPQQQTASQSSSVSVPATPVKKTVVIPVVADINEAKNQRRLLQLVDEVGTAFTAHLIDIKTHDDLLEAISIRQNDIDAQGAK